LINSRKFKKVDNTFLLNFFGFLIGLLFHAELSLQPFGSILTILEYNPLIIIITCFYWIFLLYSVTQGKVELLTLLITQLIFYPSIYIFRFGIFEELNILLVGLGLILRALITKSNLRINKVNLSLFLYFLLMAIIGLSYSIKSIRYIMTSFSILALFLILEEIKKSKNYPRLQADIVSVSYFYYVTVVLCYLLSLFLTPYPTLYLHGIGYAPTTWVNIPTLFVVPYFCFLLLKGGVKKSKIYPLLSLAFIVVVLSDSRTGFIPFLISLPFLFIYGNLKNFFRSIFLFISISISIGYIRFNNPYWIFTTIESFTSIIEIGGSKSFNYYGKNYVSNSGDTGRYVFVLASISESLGNPLYALFGKGFYSYYYYNFDIINRILISLGGSTDLPNLSTNLDNGNLFSSLPRPPSLGIIITELGLFFLMYLTLAYAMRLIKARNIFHFGFIATFIFASLYIEIIESMLFFLFLAEKEPFLNIFYEESY